MIEAGSRIDWKLTIPFLIIVWLVCAIDQSWIVATGWTAIMIGLDMLLAILNKFGDLTTEGNKKEK